MTEPNMEWEKEFVEKGADIEHDRWARWQKYMFSKGVIGPDGEFHLPEEFVDRWFRQIDTPYSELSESEKESDRKETRNYLSLIRQAISEAEIHGFCNAQNGYAEVVKKLSDDAEKAEQRGYEKGFSDGHLNGWNEAIEKSAAEERGRIAEQLKESGVTCPEAYGFEGRETYSDCGKCIVCSLLSLINDNK